MLQLGIFDETIFTMKTPKKASVFIKAMHPKTEISPSPTAIEKILKAGWAGQMKVHGHRAQIHLSADPAIIPVAYNRQGKPHKKLLPDEIIQELRRILKLKSDWTVIDAEWLKNENKLFLFDILKLDGKILRALNYAERWKLLPKLFISPNVQVLNLITTVPKCLELLQSKEEYIEGLVFRSINTKGFSDTSIIRCRKPLSRHA